MKRYMSILMVVLLAAGLMLGGYVVRRLLKID